MTFSRCLIKALYLSFFLSAVVSAQMSEIPQPPGYLAPVRIHTVEELSSLLQQAEELPAQSEGPVKPIMFVLHGEEARSFIRGNYQANQSLIDQSAKLTALGVVQIEICERWMAANAVQNTQLQPFVKTVRFAPKRITALKDEGYIYF